MSLSLDDEAYIVIKTYYEQSSTKKRCEPCASWHRLDRILGYDFTWLNVVRPNSSMAIITTQIESRLIMEYKKIRILINI